MLRIGKSNTAEKAAALDALRANVMLADEKLNITYMNKTLVHLLREAENELKRELPRFSVETLIGNNIDIFHKNPTYQRNMLAKLEKPHAATIRVGSRVFDLMVIPIFNGGKRTGFAVEWADAKERLLNVDYAGQIEAIGRFQATIEFTPQGEIVTANENFLNLLGYRLDEIKGQHHRMFVEPAYAQSAEYREFWSKLNAGEFVAAEFKRIGKGGKECWVQASYNPILDMNKKVVKVVKFATDIAERMRAVNEIGAGLSRLADKNLEHQIEKAFAPAFEKLRVDFNASLEKLQSTVLQISDSTNMIQEGTQEIATASDDLSRRTEQQAAALEETAAALDEITATVKKSAEGASHARQVVATADDDAKKSAVVVRQAVEAMDAIAKSAQEISQIIGVIDEIAFQTNLLALNAGVEAARAGDAGRGFAVVASEVRALAQRSAEAAKEIKGLISASTTQVDHGVKLVAKTGKALEHFMTQMIEINAVVSDIAAGAKEQAIGLDQVNTAINQMDQATQQNAAMVEESTAASHSLSQETSQLSHLIGQFQVGQAINNQAMTRKLQKVAPHAFRQPAKAVAAPGARKPQTPPARAAFKAVVNGASVTEESAAWKEF